jgi:hypothetical protein
MSTPRTFLCLASALLITGAALLAPAPSTAAPSTAAAASECTASIADTFGAPTVTEQTKITVTVTWSHCRKGNLIKVGTQIYIDRAIVVGAGSRYGSVFAKTFSVSAANGTATKTYPLYVFTKGENDRALTLDKNQAGIVGPFVNCTVPPQPWDDPAGPDSFSVESKYSITTARKAVLSRGHSNEAVCVPLPATA